MPPPADHLGELIGARTSHSEPTIPISPEALAGLLDHLEATHPELWLAVALVGCYRAAASRAGGASPEGRPALCRGRQAQQQDGRGPENRTGWSCRWSWRGLVGRPVMMAPEPWHCWRRAWWSCPWRSATLPPARSTKRSGMRSGNCSTAAVLAGPGGARRLASPPTACGMGSHGGGHTRQPPIPLRDLAAVMGHGPQTHLRHYGRWTAEADLIASFAPPATGGVDTAQPHR